MLPVDANVKKKNVVDSGAVPVWKISFCCVFLQLSVLTRRIETPQTTMFCSQWLRRVDSVIYSSFCMVFLRAGVNPLKTVGRQSKARSNKHFWSDVVEITTITGGFVLN